jgi:hypothetical protein
LLSLGVTAAGAGGMVAVCRLRDRVQSGHTRRAVRRSLTDAKGQASLDRLVLQSSNGPVVRVKRPDTSLIGRHSPDLHRLVRQRQSMETLVAASTTGPTTPLASAPALPVAG